MNALSSHSTKTEAAIFPLESRSIEQTSMRQQGRGGCEPLDGHSRYCFNTLQYTLSIDSRQYRTLSYVEIDLRPFSFYEQPPEVIPLVRALVPLSS